MIRRVSGLRIPPAAQWSPFGTRTPPGGWRISLPIPDTSAKVTCAGKNADQLLDLACKALLDRGKFISVQDTIDQVIAVYAARPGVVLSQKHMAPIEDPKPVPSIWGEHLWSILHLVCATEPFNPQLFHQTLEMARIMISDSNIGCEECAGHFKAYVDSHPFLSITAAGDAARWTYDFHNAVNVRLGKRSLTYQQAALMWGWVPTPQS